MKTIYAPHCIDFMLKKLSIKEKDKSFKTYGTKIVTLVQQHQMRNITTKVL